VRRLGFVGAIAALVAAGVLIWVVRDWSGSGALSRPIAVLVPEGASLGSTAAQLERAGAIPSARRFRLLARVFGSGAPVKAGEYRVPAGASPSEILTLLQQGRTLQRLVAVPEGLPSVLVQEAIEKADGLTGSVSTPAEGSVLPDSYAFQRGDTRAAVLARMQTAMRDYLASAWKRRKPNIAVKTPQEAVVLASIVEKETGKPSERRMVASVYANRLRVGMPLQADPTVIYPITKGRPLGRRILQSELRAKNGYNTYASAGLPVGPIANPGRASIDAVLDPARSNALYFVADGTGGHVFADTLAQHNANVRRWYAIRRQRGEM